MENYLDFRNKKIYEELKIPAEKIKAGEIVVFPTETVYAIGTNGFDENAIRKIYEVKNRPFNKPISLLVSDLEMVKKLAKNITEEEEKLMKAFFPGPFTIVLEKSNLVPDILTSNGNTVGIRMPDDDTALNIIKLAGVPIAAPSANITGKKSGTNITDIFSDFGENVDYYVDGGESKIGIGSTIVKMVDGKPIILRQGSITEKEIEEVLK